MLQKKKRDSSDGAQQCFVFSGFLSRFSFSLNFDLLPSYVSRGEFTYAARNESEDKRLREDIFVQKILVYLLSRLQTVS